MPSAPSAAGLVLQVGMRADRTCTRTAAAERHGAPKTPAMPSAVKTARGSAVAGYLRITREDEAQLARAAEEIWRCASDKGYLLTEVLHDIASEVSVHRPVFDGLVRDVAAGRYAGVIVPSLANLGRPKSAALRLAARIEAAGGWVEFVHPEPKPVDLSPEGGDHGAAQRNGQTRSRRRRGR